jgi:hypothetical protein
MPENPALFQFSSRSQWIHLNEIFCTPGFRITMSCFLSLIALLAFLGMGSRTVWAGINAWTSIGPDGGSVQALAIDPQNLGTVYAGTSGAGVFKSTNGGTSWSAANAGLTAFNVSTLAVDPQNSGTLYATAGGSVFKTTDGGAHWSEVYSAPTYGGGGDYPAYSLAIDPQVPSTVYAGSRPGGVWKSTDGGANWDMVNSGLTLTSRVNSLAIDPQNPNTFTCRAEFRVRNERPSTAPSGARPT